MDRQHIYMCIDLKSFYASVECASRGLDPFTTNLVVADPTRTRTTICLAITPAMKDLGVRNRCRVFEIPDNIDYVMAPPRMRTYMEVSADIYAVYLRFISPEDIHVYSIDEVFIDATSYLQLYGKTPKELANMLMDAVFEKTGICATAGIGTNLFLAKVALDITAKHVDDHIGFLTEETFAREVGAHRPITDVWNIGPGIARRLAKYHVFDLNGVCEMDPSLLYKEFGVNAELLIDHAHGVEPCTMKQIHDYVPKGSSVSSGQVLMCSYSREDALVVVKEMVDDLVLDLIDKGLVAESIFLQVAYERSGPTVMDTAVGRQEASAEAPVAPAFVGEHGKRPGRMGAHTGGSRKLGCRTASLKTIKAAFLDLYDETTLPDVGIRKLSLGFGQVLDEDLATVDLFTDVQAASDERAVAQAVLDIKRKFGKNALVRGLSLTEKATARDRNQQVGGHHA